MVASIKDDILDHLNMSREKQNIILNKEQETAVKDCFIVSGKNSANQYSH